MANTTAARRSAAAAVAVVLALGAASLDGPGHRVPVAAAQQGCDARCWSVLAFLAARQLSLDDMTALGNTGSTRRAAAAASPHRHDAAQMDHHHIHRHAPRGAPAGDHHHTASGHSTHGDAHRHFLSQTRHHHPHPHAHLTAAELWEVFERQFQIAPAPGTAN